MAKKYLIALLAAGLLAFILTTVSVGDTTKALSQERRYLPVLAGDQTRKGLGKP
jgi:hypothetical protein